MIILIGFGAYGGLSYYLNYYIHSFIIESAEIFEHLLNRNTYTALLNVLLRESIKNRNKDLLFNSPNPSWFKHYQDYKNELMYIELKLNEYHQKIRKRIFSNYIKIIKDLDSKLFCKYANNYPIGWDAGNSFIRSYRLL